MTQALRSMVARGLPAVVAATAMALAPGVAAPGSAAMASTGQDRVVSGTSSSSTPNVLCNQTRNDDGELVCLSHNTSGGPESRVLAITRVGSEIVLGGTFQRVVPPGEGEAYAKAHPKLTRHPFVVAFDASTGKIDQSFKPKLDHRVTALVPGKNNTVYAGGYFDHVNGRSAKGLTRLSLDTGKAVSGFNAKIAGHVRDLAMANGHLYLGGPFTHVGGAAHSKFAAVNPKTGGVVSGVDVQFSGTHNGGYPRIERMAVSPDGSKLVAIGNFSAVDGQARHQIAMLNLTGSAASLAGDWNTEGFAHACSTSFDTYMRGVDFSPDGSYFVVATTGASGSDPSPLCDAASRWETSAAGQDVRPTWIEQTGNDTFLSVAVTGAAVYVGGHQRWVNNPHGKDAAGPGAVPRPGIVALDPDNGLPFSWDPGRIPRGYGAGALLATDRGLWVGSDTKYIGKYDRRRERIAFFPLAGGSPVPANHTATLPGDVYMFGSSAGGDKIARRSFDGQHAGPVEMTSSQGMSDVRGAARIDGTLWYGTADGGFHKRAFGATTFGKASSPHPYKDRFGKFPGEKPGFYDQMPNVTGMFYAGGKLYYTLTGHPSLYYRYFTPESGVIGGKRFTADTAGWASVRGMFRTGDAVYYGTPTGVLHRVDFSGGQPGADSVASRGGWNAAAMALVHTDGDVHGQSGGGDPSPSPSASASTTPGGPGSGGSGSGDPSGTGSSGDPTHARAMTAGSTQSDDGAELPFTGLDLGVLLACAVVALAGGTGLVLVARRRRVGAHRGI
ncbi:MAG: PKD domain-containing protein [Streptosporangiaceae bacterium]